METPFLTNNTNEKPFWSHPEIFTGASFNDEDRVFLAESVLLVHQGAGIGNPVFAVKDETVPVAARLKWHFYLPPVAPSFQTSGIRRPAVEVAAETNSVRLPFKGEKDEPLLVLMTDYPTVGGGARREDRERKRAERAKECLPAQRTEKSTEKPACEFELHHYQKMMNSRPLAGGPPPSPFRQAQGYGGTNKVLPCVFMGGGDPGYERSRARQGWSRYIILISLLVKNL